MYTHTHTYMCCPHFLFKLEPEEGGGRTVDSCERMSLSDVVT